MPKAPVFKAFSVTPIIFHCINLSVQLDDGFSGTNFNRPGVQSLLEDAKNEKFDCVVVKDFSRFGRNYIEVGSYLEQIFPFLGIRFISINDCYDSANYKRNALNLDINFKNLLYDLYSKDLSQKVKSSLCIKKENGQYISSIAPFGYEKSLDDRHMLIICEEEAEVVQKIFSLALQGATSYQIAKKFNLENIPTPIEFKIIKGKTFRKPKGDKFYWSSSVICSILCNPVYVGDIQYGKTEKNEVGGCNILKARTEWKIIRNHHAPIITKEDFEQVQKNRRKSYRREKKDKYRHPLVGKVICGCCKHNLRIKKEVNSYFTCDNRYVTGLNECVGRVNIIFLEQIVLSRLEKHLEEQNLIIENINRYKNNLKEKRDVLFQDIRQTKIEYNRLKQKHYENYQLYSLGKQSKFYPLHEEMTKKQKIIQELQEQIFEIDEQIRETELENFITSGNSVLMLEVLKQYIDTVVVYNEEDIRIKWKI